MSAPEISPSAVLGSRLDASSPEYAADRAAMLAALGGVDEVAATVLEAGGATYVDRDWPAVCGKSGSVPSRCSLPLPIRFIGEVIEGGAKPVGGEDDPAVQLVDRGKDEEEAREIVATLERASQTGTGHQQASRGEAAFVVDVQRD